MSLKRGGGQVLLKKIERVIFVNQALENEFHFLFKCEHPEIKELRLKYIPTFYLYNMNPV
jgi:hypothetical protein